MEVIALAALSVDGFIARKKAADGSDGAKESSTKWTSKEDARWFSKKTKEIGICVMGRTTYETIGRPLPGRSIIIISRSGRPISEAPDLSPTPTGTVVTTSSSPTDVMVELERRGVTSLAVCGGSSIYTQFLQQKLINRLFLTRESVLWGQGTPLCSEPLDLQLQLVAQHPLSEQTTVFEYVVF